MAFYSLLEEQLFCALTLVDSGAYLVKCSTESLQICVYVQELDTVQRMLGVKAPGEVDTASPDSAEMFAAAVQEQPLLLDSECVGEALGELERLFPATTNVKHMLLRDPAYLLRVQRGQRRIGVHPDSFPDASYIDVQTPRHKQYPQW